MLFKKISRNRKKYCNKQNKQTTIFLPKINNVFLRRIWQNLNGRSVLDIFVVENNPLDKSKKMRSKKKFYIFRKMVKNAKWWSKSNLPLFLTVIFYPFLKGFQEIQMLLNKLISNSKTWTTKTAVLVVIKSQLLLTLIVPSPIIQNWLI